MCAACALAHRDRSRLACAHCFDSFRCELNQSTRRWLARNQPAPNGLGTVKSSADDSSRCAQRRLDTVGSRERKRPAGRPEQRHDSKQATKRRVVLGGSVVTSSGAANKQRFRRQAPVVHPALLRLPQASERCPCPRGPAQNGRVEGQPTHVGELGCFQPCRCA